MEGTGNKMKPWIQTHTGLKFDLTAPTPEMVCIEDIAHALSHLGRFTGHTRKLYTVAQHSFLVAAHVPEEDALQALLHDATEAYVGDVSSPLKQLLPAYKAIEASVREAICLRFDLPFDLPPSVKVADLRMLMTEARDLLGPPPASWHIDAEPYPIGIHPFEPETAKATFLTTWESLRGSR